MTNEEKALLTEISSFENFENYFENEGHIDAPKATPQVHGTLKRAHNQPLYQAQFDLEVKTIYIATQINPGSIITPSALANALQTGLPVYLFGHSDYSGGFNIAKTKMPVNPAWTLSQIFTYKATSFPGFPYAIPLAVQAICKTGDLVMCYQDAALTTAAYVIITSPNIAYATLLDSISSDRFIINQFRCNVGSDAFSTQFKNGYTVIKQTLFGKATDDIYSSNSFINPFNNLKYIVDVPLIVPIDKNKLIATYMNFDCQDMTISIFVKTVSKLQA